MSKDCDVKVDGRKIHLSITGCVEVIQMFPFFKEETIADNQSSGSESKEKRWYIRIFWRKDISHGSIKQRVDLPVAHNVHELTIVSDGRNYNLIKTTNGVVKNGEKVIKSEFEEVNVENLDRSFVLNKIYHSS